jgi:hypothetical protein
MSLFERLSNDRLQRHSTDTDLPETPTLNPTENIQKPPEPQFHSSTLCSLLGRIQTHRAALKLKTSIFTIIIVPPYSKCRAPAFATVIPHYRQSSPLHPAARLAMQAVGHTGYPRTRAQEPLRLGIQSLKPQLLRTCSFCLPCGLPPRTSLVHTSLCSSGTHRLLQTCIFHLFLCCLRV